MEDQKKERPKRRSRALEVLEAQNAAAQVAEEAEEQVIDMTEEEINLISGLIMRVGDIPKTP